MPRQHKHGISRRDFLKTMAVAVAATELSACTALRPKPSSGQGEKIQLVY